DAVVNFVLQNVEIEVHQGRVLVRLLQAARVEGNRKTVNRVGQHVAKNRLRFVGLRKKNVHWPNRVAISVAEFDEKHFAADELVHLAALELAVISSRIL